MLIAIMFVGIIYTKSAINRKGTKMKAKKKILLLIMFLMFLVPTSKIEAIKINPLGKTLFNMAYRLPSRDLKKGNTTYFQYDYGNEWVTKASYYKTKTKKINKEYDIKNGKAYLETHSIYKKNSRGWYSAYYESRSYYPNETKLSVKTIRKRNNKEKETLRQYISYYKNGKKSENKTTTFYKSGGLKKVKLIKYFPTGKIKYSKTETFKKNGKRNKIVKIKYRNNGKKYSVETKTYKKNGKLNKKKLVKYNAKGKRIK